ncbi:MAG: acyl-CoA/acyl-ACP dehydrogenase [Deltaproteobacteria bacterium]|nr:acyl-CoA/acyl-ACP dehydrogenase [Deltaproteobacteria bacterium]
MLDNPEKYGPKSSEPMIARASAARFMAGRMVLSTLKKVMEFMGSYGYSFEYQIEKYYRDIIILQQGFGGPQRDALDTIRSYYTFDWK